MCIVYCVISNNKWHTLVTNLHLVILKHYLSGDDNTMASHHRTIAIFVELQKIGRCIWSNWKLTLWQTTKQQQLRNVLNIIAVNFSGEKFGESTLQASVLLSSCETAAYKIICSLVAPKCHMLT